MATNSEQPIYSPIPYVANSSLVTSAIYHQRANFKYSAPYHYAADNKNYIDLWYDTPFYGKTNQSGIFYVPKPTKMKFALGDKAIAFDFVYDALRDFQFFMNKATAAGKNTPANLFADFKVATGYTNSLQSYVDYISNMIKNYNSTLLQSENIIADIKSWVQGFIDMSELAHQNISFYSFYTDKKTNIMTSGLSFEFMKSNHDADYLKWVQYTDSSFVHYAQAAANFGFRVNLNAPWQLIADLNSKPMRGFVSKLKSGKEVILEGYLSQYAIPTGNNPNVPNLEYLFEKYYDKAIIWSYSLLKTVLVYGWQEYVNDKKNIVYTPDPIIKIGSFKSITTASLTRDPNINIALQKEINIPSHYVNEYFLTIMEKILKYEFAADCDSKYRRFRKRYDLLKKKENQTFHALTKLETFYSPSRIVDPATGLPLWQTSHNKDLTEKDIFNKLLYEKTQPTADEKKNQQYKYAKSVSEFYTGFK